MSEESKKQGLPRGLIDRRGAPTGKAARLPSLRGPRDLTLGGVPKKVFTPNIPSRRDKPKEEEASVSSVKSSTSSREPRGRGRGGRGRGRGRGLENVIQSHSIFEQGPADRIVKSGSSWGKEDRVVTSKVKIEKQSKENSQRVLDNILRDDFIADSSLTEDPTLAPVHLPLSSLVLDKVKKESKDVKVKSAEEKMDVDETDSKPEVPFVKMNTPILTSRDIFAKCSSTDVEDRLLFFQLPDVLPGLPPGRDEVQKPKSLSGSDTAKKNNEEDNLASKLNTCSLSDFSEGFIGKLQIRKSGKTELVLGNVHLDVSVGTPCGFLQDLVSVQVDGESGHITSLGHVRDRLVCTPDFESLLKYS